MTAWLGVNRGDMGFLFVKYRKVAKPYPGNLVKLWDKIYDEYIAQVGLTDEYLDMMDSMQKLTEALIEATLKPTSLNKTRLASAQAEYDMNSSPSGNGSFAEFVAGVEHYLGFQLNLNEVSVGRFYAYVKVMKREFDASKKAATEK